ncbi:MAG: hypothetical protein WCA38_18680 [Candidatus Acidiferrales bacterium]
MKCRMMGAAGLAAAFVAGMVVATALGGGMSGARAAAQQQVTVQRVITPTVTDEDIALLRKDLRAMKMQVIGQNMSLSEEEGQKFWPIYNHYVRDLQEVNNQKYALLKQYAEMWATMSDQDALIYVRNWLETDGQAQSLRLKYVPVVSQVLPGRKAATFSVRPAAEHDHRSAIVFADSVGACEGVGGKRSPFNMEEFWSRSSLPLMRQPSIFRTLDELATSRTTYAVSTNNRPTFCCHKQAELLSSSDPSDPFGQGLSPTMP